MNTLTYPSNEVLTSKHSFLANVAGNEANKFYTDTKIQNNMERTVECNVHPSQKEFNVLKIILHEWKKQNSTTITFDLKAVSQLLGLNNISYKQTIKGNEVVSNNITNNIRMVYQKVENLMSFVIKYKRSKNELPTLFHFIESAEPIGQSQSMVKIRISDKFIEKFVKKNIQYVPMLFIRGEYNQKVLEFLLTKVHTKQNMVGMFNGYGYRFKNFDLIRLVDFMKTTQQYKDNPKKVKNHISKALKEIYETFKDADLDVPIPLYKLKRNTTTYEVVDYNLKHESTGDII